MAHEPFLKKMLALGQTVLSMMNMPIAICGDMRIYEDYEQSFTSRIEELRKPRIEERMDFIAKLCGARRSHRMWTTRRSKC